MTDDYSSTVSRLPRRIFRIALDLGLFVGFIVEFLTREGPDYDLHSWVGVALLPVIGVHLVTNWGWIRSTVRRKMAHPEWSLARFNAVFAVITAVCLLTGFPIWLEWSDLGAWSTIHTVTGFASMVMMFSHLWRNRSRVKSLLRRRTVSTAS